jgi:hypothetical protein
VLFSVIRGGVTADLVDNVAAFDVAPEDMYGLGRLPPRDAAVAVVDQQWFLGAAEAEALVASERTAVG